MIVKKKNYFQINSIVKVFHVLETMVSKQEWDLATLAERVGIPKATVLRMLLNLKELGYVDQTALGKRYYVTTKLFDIGSKAIPNINVFELAQPIMADLAEQCDETVYLSVLSGIDLIVIAKISSRHYLKVDSYVGDRLRSYLTSGGKALIAAISAELRARMFAHHVFEQMTEKSISTMEELEKDVTKTIERGYALIDEEWSLEIRSVGVPIFNHLNEPVAALSAVAPSARLTLEDIPRFAALVVKAGNEVSRKMGASTGWGQKAASVL